MLTVPEPLPVQPVGRRSGHWVVPDNGMTSRNARRRGSGDYSASVPARLAEAPFSPSADAAADVADASDALSRFDTYSQNVLGAENAMIGPMSSILLRTESASSSQIEDLTVGARQLALAELDESGSANARIVVGNVRTMEAALALAASLDLGAVLAMHRALMEHDRLGAAHAGELRDQLVWVGRSGSTPIGAAFIAPEADDIPNAMADLIRFIDRDDLPVLIHVALAHAQFETIHPFVDGNGRTGRALVHAMLHGKGLLRHTTAPLSAGLLTDLEGYTSSLTAFREGDARPIVEQFAAAARYAAVTGRRLVDDLRVELESSREQLSGLRPQAAGWRLLPRLVGQPIVNAAYVKNALAASDTTAQRALAQLTEAGVLAERTGNSRNRVWQHDGVLRVLDAYAAGIRRD